MAKTSTKLFSPADEPVDEQDSGSDTEEKHIKIHKKKDGAKTEEESAIRNSLT